MEEYKTYLRENERSENTVEKYLRDIRRFKEYCGDRVLTKELIIAYKGYLADNYSLSSANSMLSSLNSYLGFIGKEGMKAKQFRIQRKVYCPEERELTKGEYMKLLKACKADEKLNLILQTLCTTVIRVSELIFVTASAVRRGEFTVSCKNKVRTVFIVKELRKKLLSYIEKNRIKDRVFVTSTGKPIDRTNIWRAMKGLCKRAGVQQSKVFPHNLRHLFARTFYAIERDIAKLADILGHSSVDTTRIYIITTGAEHRRRMESMKLVI